MRRGIQYNMGKGRIHFDGLLHGMSFLLFGLVFGEKFVQCGRLFKRFSVFICG